MKKTKNYLKCGVVLVSLVLFVVITSSFVIADEPLQPIDTGGATYTPTEPVPPEIIDKVNDYIISFVGEDYFAEHLKLKKNVTAGTDNNILTYVYTHDLKDEPDDVPYQVEYVFELRADSEGELVGRRVTYKAPREPYQFLISSSEARDIAIQNGLEEPGVELYYGGQGYNSDTPIPEGSYVWLALLENDCVEKGVITGLFIHVDTGEILGRMISGGCGGTFTGEEVETVATETEGTEETAAEEETELTSTIEEETPDEAEIEIDETEKELPQEDNQTKLGSGILNNIKSIWSIVIVIALALTMLGWSAFQHIAKKRKNIMLVSFHEAKTKKMAQTLANETCKKILDALSDGELTESEIAKNLGMSISRIHYNLKSLVNAKLVQVKSFSYSKKGREMGHYSLTDKYLVIGPPKKSKKKHPSPQP